MSLLKPIENNLRRVKRRMSHAIKGPEIAPWPIVEHPSLELIFWRPERGTNFGDELSRVVVQLMLARRGITAEDEMVRPRRMLAVGSVLHQAETGTVVWGTGRNGVIPDRAHFFESLDVRAVRGPRTAEFLRSRGIAVPDVFGDPGLLLPELVGDRFARGGAGGPVFVPNLNDFRVGLTFEAIGMPVIDPRRSWNLVVAEILRYDLVIASSLHGLIVAEAFGIPARYVRLSQEESPFKYADYYEGTGRPSFRAARSIPEALDMGGEPLPRLSTGPLASAFPYDLWSFEHASDPGRR